MVNKSSLEKIIDNADDDPPPHSQKVTTTTKSVSSYLSFSSSARRECNDRKKCFVRLPPSQERQPISSDSCLKPPLTPKQHIHPSFFSSTKVTSTPSSDSTVSISSSLSSPSGVASFSSSPSPSRSTSTGAASDDEFCTIEDDMYLSSRTKGKQGVINHQQRHAEDDAKRLIPHRSNLSQRQHQKKAISFTSRFSSHSKSNAITAFPSLSPQIIDHESVSTNASPFKNVSPLLRSYVALFFSTKMVKKSRQHTYPSSRGLSRLALKPMCRRSFKMKKERTFPDTSISNGFYHFNTTRIRQAPFHKLRDDSWGEAGGSRIDFDYGNQEKSSSISSRGSQLFQCTKSSILTCCQNSQKNDLPLREKSLPKERSTVSTVNSTLPSNLTGGSTVHYHRDGSNTEEINYSGEKVYSLTFSDESSSDDDNVTENSEGEFPDDISFDSCSTTTYSPSVGMPPIPEEKVLNLPHSKREKKRFQKLEGEKMYQ